MWGQMEKGRKRFLQFLLLLVSIILGFGLLCVRVWYDRTTPVRVVIGEESKNTSMVNITANIPKYWDDVDEAGNPCVGVQYDFFVENHMRWPLIDWEMLITMPKEAKIDSSWSGQFLMTDKEILYRPDPDRDVYRVKSGNTEGFGMVLMSDEIMVITDFLLVGYRDAKITGYFSFYILISMAVIWAFSVALYMTMKYRTKSLEQQRIRDQKIIVGTMQIIAGFIDAKDEYTTGHSNRVSQYATKIAEKMKLDEEQIKNIGYIAMMHDCGKMGVRDNVLNKPGKLTDEEMEIMRTHTILGGKVLQSMTAIVGMREGALYHHERYDGAGYPEGLKGNQIPLCARIICVADSFDAMHGDRVYRKHLDMNEIIRELEDNMGKQFDPEIAGHMVDMLRSGEIQ